jgi:hypothetical protein
MTFFEQSIIDQFTPELSTELLKDAYIYTYSTLKTMNLTGFIGLAMRECCGSNIGMQYINTSIQALKNSHDNNDTIYDFLAVFNVDITQLKLRPKNLKNNIIGFIIVQKGECLKYPDVYSINLICSRPQYKKGSILFGAYIYSLINNFSVMDKRGVLELANAYFNPPGLCLYSKLGFITDLTMYGSDCFVDHYNLPMILDISTYGTTIDEQNSRLIGILNGDKSQEFARDNLCLEKSLLQ